MSAELKGTWTQASSHTFCPCTRVLLKITRLCLGTPIYRNLTWVLLVCRSSVAELAPNAQGLVNAFGIPEHLVAAPIAADWETYNAVDNRGELLNIAF